jgi:hypothetical protein
MLQAHLLSCTVTIYTTDTTKARGLTLTGVSISLAGGEGRGAMICLVLEACNSGMH